MTIATGKGHVSAVEELAKAEAALVGMAGSGGSPLWVACREGHVECVRVLVGFGAEAGWASSTGQTCVHAAVLSGELGVVEAVVGAVDVGGGVVDMVDETGCSALMVGCELGEAEMVRVLLGAGADVSVADADGRTAVEVAGECGHDEVVEVLREAEAARRPLK